MTTTDTSLRACEPPSCAERQGRRTAVQPKPNVEAAEAPEPVYLLHCLQGIWWLDYLLALALCDRVLQLPANLSSVRQMEMQIAFQAGCSTLTSSNAGVHD